MPKGYSLNGTHYKQLPYGEAAFNDLFARYKGKAEKRLLSFELTKEQFKQLTTQECRYCGRQPHRIHTVNKRVGEYVYNGIDRVDNDIGYVESNSYPCCYDCNRMKHNMGEKEFLEHIERIHAWQQYTK